MTTPYKVAGLSSPYFENESWCVDEQLYPESRGYLQHKFESRKQAYEFVAKAAQKLGSVSTRPQVEILDQKEKDLLKSALKNADTANQNGEWLIWCGGYEHAAAILDAARAYFSTIKIKEE